MVRDGTAAGTDGTADESALTATCDCADDGTSGCRAPYDLGTGVVAVVAACLGALGVLVGGLGESRAHCESCEEDDRRKFGG